MKHISVLVVDDEKSLREFVCRNLQVRNFTVHTASNGLEALALFQAEQINLVILDLIMPHMDGMQTIAQIRKSSQVPVIILSALGEESYKVQALNLGADDYLTKPFGVEELLARVNAVLRRARWLEPSPQKDVLICDDISVDLKRHKVTSNNQPIDLTPTEFNLLVYFMEHKGQVLRHEVILRNVWGPEYGQEAEYLRVYIGRLRQKIEADAAKPRHLLTERGVGYVFV